MRVFNKVILSAVALSIAALVAAGPAAAQTKLKWAHVYETSEPYHKWSVWAADEIKKRTGGRYEIAVFPASQLGKETDINQGLQLGTVDMIISGLSFAARTMPRIGVGYYPYTFRDGDHLVSWAKSGAFKELTDEYRQKTGIQITAMTYYGARHTTSNRDFNDCAGMKGLKIRVPDVPAYMALPKSCGANPTPIAFAEVYLALQNGTVEAQENPLTTIEAKKFYEVQKNVILTGHIVDSLATQVAPHVWTKLSDADKKTFTDVMQEAAAGATGDIKKREAELADEFKKKGLNVHAVDRKGFQEAIMKTVSLESMGYAKADWDKIQQIK
jgi:tripartite ATP-independent transporter DctP family solute receptor